VRVSLVCDYFVAGGDEEAAVTADWPGGPSQSPERRWWRRTTVRPFPSVRSSGIEPVVLMGRLAGLLAGKDVGAPVEGSAASELAASVRGPRTVFRVSDGLARALADVDVGMLHAVAGRLSVPGVLADVDVDVLVRELAQLVAIARLGRRDHKSLYCWTCS
jgi:hypothetical protein